LTRRRLGGAALLLAGIAVAVVVLLPALRGDDSGARTLPVRVVSVPELGFAFTHPRSWKHSVSGRVVRVWSKDGTAIMTFASPVAGRESRRVKDALRRGLGARLKGETVVRDGRGRLAGRSVDTLEVVGVGRKRRIRALAIVATSKWRTYAITLLTPARPSRKRLAEVSRILATVRFAKPVRPKR
ncbi:MAG: hypothetical protein M3N04_00185, partial [Actinomycetota bacterium]|nr:hypothetical protein [Actinomycetota bacterium]